MRSRLQGICTISILAVNLFCEAMIPGTTRPPKPPQAESLKKSITVKPRQRVFTIELESNPSTGYQWELVEIDSVIETVGKILERIN